MAVAKATLAKGAGGTLPQSDNRGEMKEKEEKKAKRGKAKKIKENKQHIF